MIEMQPCMPQSIGLHAFLAVMQVLQAVALAYIAQRAVRKNREDRNGNYTNAE